MDHNYSFAYFTKGNEDVADEFPMEDNLMRNLKYDQNITWDCVLRDFIGFLSAVYGYDISKSVEFKTHREKLEDLRKDDAWYLYDDKEDADGKGPEAA